MEEKTYYSIRGPLGERRISCKLTQGKMQKYCSIRSRSKQLELESLQGGPKKNIAFCHKSRKQNRPSRIPGSIKYLEGRRVGIKEATPLNEQAFTQRPGVSDRVNEALYWHHMYLSLPIIYFHMEHVSVF